MNIVLHTMFLQPISKYVLKYDGLCFMNNGFMPRETHLNIWSGRISNNTCSDYEYLINYTYTLTITIANSINTSNENSLASNRISFVTSNTTTIPTISRAQLPPEVPITIKNIEKGGPFPFPNHDGTTILNREGILPSKPSGY